MIGDRVGVLTSIYIRWHQNETSVCNASGRRCHLISGPQKLRGGGKKNVEKVLAGNVSSLRLEERLHRAGSEQTCDFGVASGADKMWILVFSELDLY